MYQTLTAVEGRTNTERMKSEAERIQDAIPKSFKGMFNAKPAQYELEIPATIKNNFFRLQGRFKEGIRSYLSPDTSKRDVGAYEEQGIVWPLADILPHHSTVIIENGFPKFNSLDWFNGTFADLGYTITRWRDTTSRGNPWQDSYSPGQMHRRELLRVSRSSSETSIEPVDSRAHDILKRIQEGTKAHEYELVEFIPKHWMSLPHSTPYSPASELRSCPVKKTMRTPAQWLSKNMESFATDLPLTRALGISSRVQVEGEIRHIPMIDFNVPHGDQQTVHDTLKRIGISGIIVDSGASYHFYGSELLTPSVWEDYTYFLDELGGVDEKWTEIQLKQGYSMLRLTPSIRKFSQPCFIKEFHPKLTGPDGRTDDAKVTWKKAA